MALTLASVSATPVVISREMRSPSASATFRAAVQVVTALSEQLPTLAPFCKTMQTSEAEIPAADAVQFSANKVRAPLTTSPVPIAADVQGVSVSFGPVP